MGSRLRYTTDTGEDRSVTLVFPGEADIAEAHLGTHQSGLPSPDSRRAIDRLDRA